jgi:formylglycine-generating enzyme required for sulfatase activity
VTKPVEPPPKPSPTPPKRPIENSPANTITNSIGMKLKRIKAGAFKMGAADSDKAALSGEKPQHEVEITRPFYLGVYPVTKVQFAAFVRDTDYKTEAEQAGNSHTWRTPNFLSKSEQTGDDPVVEVSWKDAEKFCAWLSQKENKSYGLPTEAQWEYADRAGTTTAYFFGDDPKTLGDYAWYLDNSEDRTHPVGSKKPNPWGLYDMNGNVWQWCADGYGEYKEGGIRDPKSIDNASSRVLRGGSWRSAPRDCRSAYRRDRDPKHRSVNDGFRVVLRMSARTP